MPCTQDEIFAASEGDRYFERNEKALAGLDLDADLPLRLLDLYGLQPRSAVEIGAANGFRLAEIARRWGARAVAVDASAKALLQGKASFPCVRFVVGLAHAAPLRQQFDLAIVHFVLHWVDRRNLLASIAEIDRLLVDGGYLIIGDFQPVSLTKVRYHHLAGQQVYTYKQNYAGIFLASCTYEAVCHITGGHASKTLEPDAAEDQRIGVWLLRKTGDRLYRESRLT